MRKAFICTRFTFFFKDPPFGYTNGQIASIVRVKKGGMDLCKNTIPVDALILQSEVKRMDTLKNKGMCYCISIHVHENKTSIS